MRQVRPWSNVSIIRQQKLTLYRNPLFFLPHTLLPQQIDKIPPDRIHCRTAPAEHGGHNSPLDGPFAGAH